MTRIAAFFDLDKTIIATSSAAALSKPFMARGLVTRAEALRSGYAHFLYLFGGADEARTERLRASLSRMAAGWDVAQVSRIVADTLHDVVDPYVYAEAVDLIDNHRAHGHDVVIVSASSEELVRPIATMLGAKHVIATRMNTTDGRYTGEIDFYAYGENKAIAMRELAEREGYDLAASYAYSDSITDSPMLSAVGHAFTVNPDRVLRRLGTENGWKPLQFSRPVTLRHRLRPTTPLLVTGAGVVVAAVATWAVVRAVRRHSHASDAPSIRTGCAGSLETIALAPSSQYK